MGKGSPNALNLLIILDVLKMSLDLVFLRCVHSLRCVEARGWLR